MKINSVENKLTKKILFPILVFSALLAVSATHAFASGDHEDSHDSSASKHSDHDDGEMKGMFLKKKQINGYTVSFHVMKAKKGMNHGGTHNVMIKVEKNGSALNDVVINSKIVYPNDRSESKMLRKMGDWYMAGYDLGHKEKHQLMILFKTSDGKKHKGGVYYSG